MEKIIPEEYRETLANKLRKLRNSTPENIEIGKAMAEGYLTAEKESSQYKNLRKSHLENLEILRERQYTISLTKFPANLRIQKVLEYGWKGDRVSLLESMIAVDQAYTDGIVSDFWGINLSSVEFDLKKYEDYLDSLTDKIKRLKTSDIKLNNLTGYSWVSHCEGDHYGEYPTRRECDFKLFNEGHIRREKLRKTLEKFKRTPEQVEAIIRENSDKKRDEEYKQFNWNI